MEDVTTQQKDDNIWKVAFALVCGAILGYGFFYSKNTTSDLAFLVGYNLPTTLLIWGVFYAAVARKRGAKIAGFSFLAIFINAFIERLWRSVKYEDIYLRAYETVHDVERGLNKWFEKYNHYRPHSSLGGKTPWVCYEKHKKAA